MNMVSLVIYIFSNLFRDILYKIYIWSYHRNQQCVRNYSEYQFYCY